MSLPAWASKAIDNYEAKKANGELTFNGGKFADMPSQDPDRWISDLLTDHLPTMDISPHDDSWERPDPYPELHDGGFRRGSYG